MRILFNLGGQKGNMILKFNSAYQSITSLETEINGFAVINGLNGSGKTHLLNAIHNGQVNVEGIDLSEIIFYNYYLKNWNCIICPKSRHSQNAITRLRLKIEPL